MQLVMPFALGASYEPSDFIRGSANEAAASLVERWPDWPYSIVLLYGEAGSGKTHLSHVFAQRAKASFVDTQRVGTVPADQLLVGNHAWILDGLEAVADTAALAQLINHVRARGDYLLLTAHVAPAQMQIPLADLRSRLLALPTVALEAPDDALLMGVLAKQFADRQLRISHEVLHYITHHVERSFGAVKAFVEAVDQRAWCEGRAVTIPLARAILQSSLALADDAL